MVAQTSKVPGLVVPKPEIEVTTPVGLHRPRAARERILLFGGFGSGKSYAWVKIAEHNYNSKNGSKLYILDTDHTALQQSIAFDGFEEVVKWRDIFDMKELKKSTVDMTSIATKDDWLVVDLADKPWVYAQDDYTERAFGKDAEDFFVSWKAQGGTGGSALASEWGSNWQVINKIYNAWITDVFRFPGHILFCAASKVVKQPDNQGKGGDDRQTLDTFGKFGFKPAGQGNLGFQMMTVLAMANKGGSDDYIFTTVKDLHREKKMGAPIKDFVTDYLIPIAGWVE